MADPALAYYIYYRVDAAQAEAARNRVDALLARIHARCGVRGRWLRKRDEPLLWMEIYEPVTDEQTFERALRQATEEADFGSLLQAGAARHIERFEALA